MVVFVVLFLAAPACVGPRTPSARAEEAGRPLDRPLGQPLGQPLGNVVYRPHFLRRTVEVGDAEVWREARSERLRVRIPIKNVAPERQKLRVQVQFLDVEGRAYNDETALRCLQVRPGEVAWVRATSLSARARHYRVWVEWVSQKH